MDLKISQFDFFFQEKELIHVDDFSLAQAVEVESCRTPYVKVVLSCKSLSHRLVDERFMTEIRHHPQLRMLSDDNKLCMKLGLFK